MKRFVSTQPVKRAAWPSLSSTPTGRRRGMALLVVMVLTMLLALAAYRFSFYMESQYRVSRIAEEQTQARLAALSGIEIAAALLELPPLQRQSLGGLHDNPALFQGAAVEEETELGSSWRVTLVSPPSQGDSNRSISFRSTNSSVALGAGNAVGDASAGMRLGLVNEAAKLHIPSLLAWEQLNPGNARMALSRLPGATETLVDAWLQRHGVSLSANSAGVGGDLRERVSMQRNQRQLQSANALLNYHWLGGDFNQNFLLDPLESQLAARLLANQDGAASTSSGSRNDSGDEVVAVGWQHYLTWDSGVRNESAAGLTRLYLNNQDLLQLHRDLSQVWSVEWANFVIAVRQFGFSSERPGESLSAASWTPDFGQPATYQLTNVVELLGAQVVVSSGSGKQLLQNPFSGDLTGTSNYLDTLLDESTLDTRPALIGRVDVSEAPVEVLAAVPGIDLTLAQNIVQRRSAKETAMGRSIAWLLQERLVTWEQLQRLEPYLTNRSDVYSLQAVGFRDGRTPVYRCTVTVDARHIPARILHHQPWHSWDRGFSIESLSGAALTR